MKSRKSRPWKPNQTMIYDRTLARSIVLTHLKERSIWEPWKRDPEGVLHAWVQSTDWLFWPALPTHNCPCSVLGGFKLSYSVMLTTDITSLTPLALILCLYNNFLTIIWLHMESYMERMWWAEARNMKGCLAFILLLDVGFILYFLWVRLVISIHCAVNREYLANSSERP